MFAMQIKFKHTPQYLRVDAPFKIEISGLSPKSKIAINITAQDDAQETWAVDSEYTRSKTGVIKLDQKILQQLQPKSELLSGFKKTNLEPTIFTITAKQDYKVIAEIKTPIHFTDPNTKTIEIHKNSLYGTLYIPKKPKTKTCMIFVGGSGGGLPQVTPALLAANGIPTFAVAYFAYKNLPKKLENIPLETIETAINWLREEQDYKNIGIIGVSKGGELALLAATKFALAPIVGVSPSPYIFKAPAARNQVSSWTYKAQPLPFLPIKFSAIQGLSLFWKMLRKKPISFTASYKAGQESATKELLSKATIPLESHQGPLLLLTGTEDGVWPCSSFCDQALKRLKKLKPKFSYAHKKYKNTGHLVLSGAPNLPVGTSIGKDMRLDLGGTNKQNTESMVKIWQEIIDFILAT